MTAEQKAKAMIAKRSTKNLIAYYEAMLEKVKSQYPDDLHKEYVTRAEENLAAAKEGGIDALRKLWATRN